MRRMLCCAIVLIGWACDKPTGSAPQEILAAKPVWLNAGIRAIGPLDVDDSTVYVVDTSRAVHALARRDGTQRWQRALTSAGSNWDLAVRGGVVVLAADVLIALETSSGVERWRVNNADGLGTLPFAVSGTTLFPTTYRGTGTAVALDIASGVERWRAPTLPTDSSAQSGDQVRVFEPTTDGSVVAASFAWWKGAAQPKGGVTLFDAATGARRWSVILPSAVASASTFPSRAVIGSDAVAVTTQEGLVYLLEITTGARRWTGRTVLLTGADTVVPQPSDIRPVAITSTGVVVGSARGYVALYHPTSGAVIWSTPTGAGGINRVIPVDHNRVLTTHLTGYLALIDLATGALRWRMSPRSESERIYDVRIVGDTVYATSIVGGVSKFVLP